jgi:lysylphosphatidylglycerol synthetase-like protein (DUF2156 family)
VGHEDDGARTRPPGDEAARVALLRAWGTDAVSFQALESAMRWWHDVGPPEGTGAAVAFVDVGGYRLAGGSPLAPPELRLAAVTRFIAAARAEGREVAFVAVEDLAPFAGLRRLPLGLQSIVRAADWPATLRARRRLREQLRRARAKGVVVRRVAAGELAAGRPLRRAVEALQTEWLARRRIEPLGFLVAVEPFHAPEEHLYLVAERDGAVVQFMSAVPIHARGGWLLEDVLRSPAAPNGTTELMLDRLLREVGEAGWVTPGLTPLAGPMPWWLRLARAAARPLYDFSGLEQFRARLAPSRWDRVWLVWTRGPAVRVVAAVLRALAHGALLRFAWRSLVRHPSGPPWVLAVPLVPWTLLLAALAGAGRHDLFGFSRAALAGWALFDAGLVVLLFRAAARPRRSTLRAAAACVTFDALLSVRHLVLVGFGPSWLAAVLRLIATAAPLTAAALLLWTQARQTPRGPGP